MPAGVLMSPGSLCQLLQTQQTGTVVTSQRAGPSTPPEEPEVSNSCKPCRLTLTACSARGRQPHCREGRDLGPRSGGRRRQGPDGRGTRRAEGHGPESTHAIQRRARLALLHDHATQPACSSASPLEVRG